MKPIHCKNEKTFDGFGNFRTSSLYWDERKFRPESSPLLKGLKRVVDEEEYQRLKKAGISIEEFLGGN